MYGVLICATRLIYGNATKHVFVKHNRMSMSIFCLPDCCLEVKVWQFLWTSITTQNVSGSASSSTRWVGTQTPTNSPLKAKFRHNVAPRYKQQNSTPPYSNCSHFALCLALPTIWPVVVVRWLTPISLTWNPIREVGAAMQWPAV
jgi:hypothetical protein